MRYAFLLLLSLLPLFASAVEFDESTRQLPLGRVLDFYEDVSRTASIEDLVAASGSGLFQRHQDDVVNLGYSRSALWLRVDLTYRPTDGSGPRSWLLELNYPPMDYVDLYLPDGEGGFRLARSTGDRLPYDSREVRHGSYLFELNMQPGETVRAYLRLETEGSMQAPLTLWAPSAFLERQPERIYVLGMIYGVLLAMLVYNLFIYLSVRDPSYFYYILYIASFGLYQVSVNGAGIQFFWPDHPWWANVATPLLIGASGVFGAQFTRSFLRTAEHSVWLDRLLMVMMGLAMVAMVLSFTASYALALRMATVMALLFTVVIFIAGIIAWHRGMRVARYFIFAWSAFLVGGQINTLMVMGYLPNMFFTMYSSQIGSALEVALLSLALADRINSLKEERAQLLEQSRQQLEALNRQLVESNRLKDRFLGALSHELRTPMIGVIGALELMQSGDMDEEAAQYQKLAARSADDMLAMVNDILTLSELLAGRVRPEHAGFDPRGLFANLRRRFEPLARQKELHFVVRLDHNLPAMLWSDEAKLEQALGYLLDNAIKFTDSGTVELRAIVSGESEGLVRLQIEVEDTGIGFETPLDGSLYEHFSQLDGSMTRRHGGLGIGLALSRQLIQVLGGELDHHSRPGHGSCFRLMLALPTRPMRVSQPG